MKIGKIECIIVEYAGETVVLGNYILKKGDTGVMPLDIWKNQANTNYKNWRIHISPEEGDVLLSKLFKGIK